MGSLGAMKARSCSKRPLLPGGRRRASRSSCPRASRAACRTRARSRNFVYQLVGGLRSGMGYVGAATTSTTSRRDAASCASPPPACARATPTTSSSRRGPELPLGRLIDQRLPHHLEAWLRGLVRQSDRRDRASSVAARYTARNRRISKVRWTWTSPLHQRVVPSTVPVLRSCEPCRSSSAGRASRPLCARNSPPPSAVGAGFVLIGGEAGIGKTALARDLIHAADDLRLPPPHWFVLRPHHTPPYGPWLELFDACRRDPALPPPPAAFAERTAGRGHDQAALFAEVRHFLSALAAARPTLSSSRTSTGPTRPASTSCATSPPTCSTGRSWCSPPTASTN